MNAGPPFSPGPNDTGPSTGLPLRIAASGAVALAALGTFAGYGEGAGVALAATGAASLTCLALGLTGFRFPVGGRASDLALDIEALPAAYALGDEKGRLLAANSRFRSMFGLEAAPRHVSDVGRRDSDLSAAMFRLLSAARHAQSASQVVKLAAPAGETARVVEIEVHLCPAAFSRRARRKLLIWTAAPYIGPAQAAGERSNGLAVQLLLDALPLAAFLFDARGQVVASNAAFKALAGASELNRLTGNVSSFLLNENGEPFKALQWRHFVTKDGEKIATVKRNAMPAERMRAWFSTPPTADDKRVHSVWTLCVLTPLEGAQSGAGLGQDNLLAAAPIAIASVTQDGAILRTNPAFRALFEGAGDGEPSLPDLVHADSRDALRAALRQQPQPGDAPVTIELRIGPNGARRIRLFLSPAARPKEFIVYGIDVTAQHALEEQIAHSQKMQAMGQLAGGIAHDFNNVLTAIIGFSDLLLARFRRSDPAFQDVMNIKNSANRAAELVRHLLAYSRRQTLRPRVLSLTDVIEDFNSSLGRLLGEKVKARIVHGRDLWLVKADESQLFQVIMNLAVNARDAMPGGGTLTIRTANVTERESLALRDRGIERGEYVLWEVSDTGTGIPPEIVKKIFDPFFSTKEVGKGTGLGLSLVDGIIKQTGGSILVDSTPGEGTTFRIYLPRYQESEEEEAQAAQVSRKPEAAAADLTGSATVLLVEDEDAVRSFASRALSARGYEVLEASSGAEALELMDRRQGAVDLVVSDVVMPEMDGPTLLAHLRRKQPGIRIVFMSGYAEEAFRKNLSEDEKFFFLPKPFTLKKLAETIKEATAA